MEWSCFELTHPGLKRKENQDTLWSAVGKTKSIFLLCDGMGGHWGGKQASNMIAHAFAHWWEGAASENLWELVEEAKGILRQVNDRLFALGKGVNAVCGSTLELLLLCGDAYGLLHVGDSRIYQLSSERMDLLTVDQTWGNVERRKGERERSEIENHPFRDRLLQAVGVGMEIAPFIRTGKAGSERFLLCSDGIYKTLGEKEMFRLFSGNPEIGLSIAAAEILNRGAPDNFSLVLIEPHRLGACGNASCRR